MYVKIVYLPDVTKPFDLSLIEYTDATDVLFTRDGVSVSVEGKPPLILLTAQIREISIKENPSK